MTDKEKLREENPRAYLMARYLEIEEKNNKLKERKKIFLESKTLSFLSDFLNNCPSGGYKDYFNTNDTYATYSTIHQNDIREVIDEGRYKNDFG